MDKEKVGMFIASCRKKQKLTQEELAEKLNITYKAVSKWETGKSLPDASIMKQLCNILHISVNELLSGEIIDKQDYYKNEEYLLEIYRQKEEGDKKLLKLELIFGIIFTTYFMFVTIFMSFLEEHNYITNTLFLLVITVSMIYIIVTALVLIRIEQIAGYYKCNNCNNRYIPSFKSINLAPHFGRTRYMKCPKCNKRTWNKKVLSKGEQND